MIRALLATGVATAAVTSAAWYLYRSGRLDGLARQIGFKRPPSLDNAYRGANASKPAPAHPWPVDPLALGKSGLVPDAA